MRSRRFVLTVLGLLGLLHLYIGLRIIPALPWSVGAQSAGVLLLLLSCLLIPAGLMARSRSTDHLSWAGLLLMGLFSSLLVFTFLRDIALGVSSLFAPAAAWHAALAGKSALAVVYGALFATLIGFLNARRRARIVDVDVPIKGLPVGLDGFTIAQISDIHVGPTIKRGYLDAIVDAVNVLGADMVAVTGDLVDGSVDKLSSHTQPLSRLNARYGSYFVTGNHEYYSGAHAWIAEVERLGLRVLKNEHVVIEHNGNSIVIAGVTDYSAHQFDPQHRSDPHAAVAGAPETTRILLAHQPRSAFAAAGAGYHLQISGHTHGGQFWPWNHFVRFQQPFTAGLRSIDGLLVYISRGTGYWGPPKRFGAPSEITRLRLIRG
ncbi:MAG: metallophosphoesterase [Rhodocyclaceae bacterium]|nr:metallophosphoesterase [Rhodocyclaceae bacterium]